MTMRAPVLARLAFAAIAFTVLAGAADERDTWADKKGKQYSGFVVTETLDKLTYKLGPQSKEQSMKWSDVVDLTYAEMRSGPWTTAIDARDRGKYEEASDLFLNVQGGGREWQKAYGAFYEGDALELAGKYEAAAEAFAKLDALKDHRLWIDGKYRQGFCLGLAKKGDDAAKVADELSEYAKKNKVTQADIRANAIRAAIAAGKDDFNALSSAYPSARFSPVSDADEWFHFALFYADTLRRLGKTKDAGNEYRNLTAQLDNDPAKKAQASFGYGQCLLETDKQAALVELLKLDALPYGSPDQKCEARFLAAKLLWDDAKAALADAEVAKDEKRSAFHKGNAETAKVLLGAAAGSIGDSPAKAKAKAMLDEITAAEKPKAAAKPGDAKAGAAKPGAADAGKAADAGAKPDDKAAAKPGADAAPKAK